MYRRWILAALVGLPLVVSGLMFAPSHSAGDAQAANPQGFVCPITGENLPCQECCPLND